MSSITVYLVINLRFQCFPQRNPPHQCWSPPLPAGSLQWDHLGLAPCFDRWGRGGGPVVTSSVIISVCVCVGGLGVIDVARSPNYHFPHFNVKFHASLCCVHGCRKSHGYCVCFTIFVCGNVFAFAFYIEKCFTEVFCGTCAWKVLYKESLIWFCSQHWRRKRLKNKSALLSILYTWHLVTIASINIKKYTGNVNLNVVTSQKGTSYF